MMVFWVVVVCLIAAALLFLLPPLLQSNVQQGEVERDKVNVQIHKDKLAELDTDLHNGVLSQDQYDRARQEIERSLLDDVVVNAQASAPPLSRKPVLISAAIVALIIPLISIALYQKLGPGPIAFNPAATGTEVKAEGHQGTIETMVEQLKERLEKDPGNAEQWMMLGRSYYFLKKYREAANAYAKASELTNDSDPNLLADYADTLAMAQGKSMQGKPYEIVKKALGIEPFHEKSLWLAGTAAYQMQELPEALGYWQKLQQTFAPGSENYEQMERNIGEIKDMMMQKGMKVPASAAVSPAPAKAKPAAVAASGNASVSGTVKIAPALVASAAPTDTLFVFARAAQGPRMPLAILRKQVKDLPLTYTLDDSLSMNPAMKLSNFQDVVVGARISKSGNAMPQSGDLLGQSDVVKVGTNKVDILINSVTP